MTLLETMFLIYAISIPLAYFIFKHLIKRYPEQLDDYSSFNLEFALKIIPFFPVLNTLIAVYYAWYLIRFNLFDRWKKDEDEEDERVEVKDLKP